MSNKTENSLTPKLRFPEFQGTREWEGKTLREVCLRITNGKANAEDHEEDGIYPLFDRSAVIKRSNTFMFDSEAVILPGEGMRFLPKYFSGRFNLHQRAYALMEHQGDARFVYYSLDCLKDLLAKKAVQSTVLSLRLPIVENFPISCPKSSEQQKIADCLSSLDELIAAQARKVDALKTHKKGLMQQLFPREGETQPRLRFPEFREAGNWVVKTLDAIAPLQRGFDLPSDDIRPGSVPIVYSNGPKGFHERGMAKGPGLVTGRSGTLGKLHFIESGDYWPHNTSLWVTSFKGHSPKFVDFLYEFIGFLRFASGSGVPTLNRNDAHLFQASVPNQFSEQERIAACLGSLDTLITTATQELETLKTHKKGLMQQLFPSAEAVEA